MRKLLEAKDAASPCRGRSWRITSKVQPAVLRSAATVVIRFSVED